MQAVGAGYIREVLDTARTVPFAGKGLPATPLKFPEFGFQKFKIFGRSTVA